MLRHVTDPAPDPRTRRADTPAWVAEVIARLLEKDPAKRYADATAVREALGGPRQRDWRRIGIVAAAAIGLFAIGMAGGKRVVGAQTWPPRGGGGEPGGAAEA